ncbi:putative tumor necrosis factor receptor superfamily member [Sesbania bispinosa]|nr:putative tumor necrosis factor receptor superfamily member [Sesbania bispinosa]
MAVAKMGGWRRIGKGYDHVPEGAWEVAIEAERVVVEGGGGLVVEHCADEGGFHGVEEMHVLLFRPNRCRFPRRHMHRRVHRGGFCGFEERIGDFTF